MKVGHGLKEGISIGPLIDHMAREKAKTHVADAVAKGGTLVVGGYEASTEQLGDDRLQGSFYVPTILVDSNTQMKIWEEETFGPVCPIMQFDDEKEAIQI